MALSVLGIHAGPAHAAAAPVTGTWVVPGDGRVTISWEPVAGATSYRVYESTTSGVTGALVGTVTPPSTTVVLAGRTNGTYYYYTVRAVDGTGESTDPVDTLETLGTMAAGRFASQCNAVMNGSIYLFAPFNTAATTEIWRFDAVTGTASLLADVMPDTNMDCAASARNGQIHLLGGGVSSTATRNAILRYVPGANPLTRVETIPSARFEMPGLTLRDKLIYAFGGRASGTSFSNVLRYDAVAGTNATSATTFAAGRAEASASAVRGNAIIAGGYRCNNGLCTARSMLTEVFRYDPVANTLTARAALPAARSGAGMVSLNDRSYLFGGITTTGGATVATILSFDDIANAWTTLGASLPVASAYHATKRIRGLVYLVGGNDGTAPINTIQRFSPGGQARGLPTAPEAATAPGTPTLTAGSGTVTVNWTAGSNVMQYRVFRSSVSGEPGTLIEEQRGLVDEPATSIVDTAVPDGTWYYSVSGIGFDERETAVSAQATVTLGAASPPVNTTLPAVSGTQLVDELLSTTNGTWTGATSYAYQWLRCDAAGNACVPIVGATSSTYSLVLADDGSTIRARVTATNASGSASVDSAATSVIVQSSLSITLAGYDASGAGPFTSPAAAASFGTQIAPASVHAEVRATVVTDDPDGYQLSLHDPDAGGALDDGVSGGSIAWVGTGAVAVPATWTGTGMGISVFGGAATPDRWCSGGQAMCTAIDDPQLLWAPLTGTSQQVSGLLAATAGDTTRVSMRVDIPAMQVAGSYSGAVTVTAVTIP